MLKQRVISAVVMVAAFILIDFFLPTIVFDAFLIALAALAGWEWSRFAGITTERNQYLTGGAFAVAALLCLLIIPEEGFAHWMSLLSLLFWLSMLAVLYLRPVKKPLESSQSSGARTLAVGIFIIVNVTWFSHYLHHSSESGSPWWFLYALMIVWVMDTGAYFAGRKFGRVKLAPSISPGKSREGVYGGLVAVTVLLLITLMISAQARDALFAITVGTYLAALVSVEGDLFESRLKRSVNLKDSSQLIPGHGGVLDRIDGVVAAVPVFAFCWIWLSGLS